MFSNGGSEHTLLVIMVEIMKFTQQIMKVSYHPQFCKLQRIYISQIGRLIPAQPNFHTLYKSEQFSPKHELFRTFWCHMKVELMSLHTYKTFPLESYICYSAAISKVYSFLGGRTVYWEYLVCYKCKI